MIEQHNTESKIQARLAEILLKKRLHWMAIGNVNGFYAWECDLLSLNKNLYLSEFEIKVTLADFKADMGKEKHRHFKNQSVNIPNYLWYVISGFECDTDLLPEYAGLMIIHEDGSLETVKKAPLIHKRKISEADYPRLLNRACKRLWGLEL